MPLPTSFRIGSSYFDLTDDGHTVQDIDLGPSGEVNFTTDDWGQGLNPAEDGVNHVKGKYASSRGADAAFPKQLILQPQATTVAVAAAQPAIPAAPVKQVDFTVSGTTNTYLCAGRYVYRLNGSQQWTQVLDLGVGIVATDAIVHGTRLAVAYSTGFQHTTSGTTYTDDATDADRFGVLGQNVWRADNPNSLYSAAAVNGTWTAATTVADSSFNVNSIIGLEQVIMIGKEDGVYSIDAEGVVVPFTPELRTQADATFAAVRAATTFNGDYYFRTLNGIIQISAVDGQKRRVGLDQLASPDFPTPRVAALAADDRYLYALCDNASADLMILRRSIQGEWHVFYWDGTSGTKQGEHLAISSALGFPALFFSYFDNASTYTTKYIRTSTFPNALQDTNYRYDITSQDKWIRLGRYATPEAPVVFDRCVIQSRNLTSSITVTPYYSVDGGARTQFGSSAAVSSPVTTIHPSTAPSGHLWDFYLYLGNTTDATTTPIVTGVSFKGRLRPSRRRMHTLTIVGVPKEARTGGTVRRSPLDVFADLNSARDTNTYLSCADENNREFSALVESVKHVAVDANSKDREPTKVFQVILAEAAAAQAANTYTFGASVFN